MAGPVGTRPTRSTNNDSRQTADRWRARRSLGSRRHAISRSSGDQLDRFRVHHNEQRPHRATGRRTRAEACAARRKAQPAGRGAPGHFRLRYDTTDGNGAMTLRRGGRLHHLKVGTVHARRRVLAIVDEQEVSVLALDTSELLSTHRIEPDKTYWRNQRRDPGRWPRSRATG